MRFFSFKGLVLSVVGIPLIASGVAAIAETIGDSEAPGFIIEALPDQLARRVQSQKDMLRQFGLGDPDKTAKGVINALKIWTTNYPEIKVCFFSGSQELRSRIAKIAMEWKSAVPGVPLDFADLDNPRLCKAGEVNHVRVGFKFPGYWSLVGQDSIKFAGQKEQSMNFEGFDTSLPNDATFHEVVLHEFGHAIGLEHEHQNPLSKCRDEFNWDKIYTWLAGPPNNWLKETTDYNMGVLNTPGLLTSTFDKKSIMLYTFPPAYFKQGTNASCYNPPNTSLSDGDKSIVAALYPQNRKEKLKLQDDIKNGHLDRIKASGQAEGAKSAVVQLIGEYMP
jgi:hypothetical protein